MDCVTSLSLLSDYHDGFLAEAESTQVRAHLDSCKPCLCIFSDLDLITVTAIELRNSDTINFPDEGIMWQQLRIVTYESH
jgi:predicted anti-sigma-YlaC factor YlaD